MKGWRETRSAFPELAAVWQRDGGKMARAWPSHRAGRLTVGGPSWRAEDRQEWRKCFEVATHPSTVPDGWSWAREKRCRGARRWQITVWIPHLPHARKNRRRTSLQTVISPFSGEGEKRRNEAGGVKEERRGGELYRGQHQGWRKGKILTAWALEKKNKINTVEIGRALILIAKVNVIVQRLSVRTSHIWFPGWI